MPSRDVKGKRCLDVWIFDELLWRVNPVDAVVVAGEDPCVLLISACHERGKLLLLGVEATRRVERQPQLPGFVSF